MWGECLQFSENENYKLGEKNVNCRLFTMPLFESRNLMYMITSLNCFCHLVLFFFLQWHSIVLIMLGHSYWDLQSQDKCTRQACHKLCWFYLWPSWMFGTTHVASNICTKRCREWPHLGMLAGFSIPDTWNQKGFDPGIVSVQHYMQQTRFLKGWNLRSLTKVNLVPRPCVFETKKEVDDRKKSRNALKSLWSAQRKPGTTYELIASN